MDNLIVQILADWLVVPIVMLTGWALVRLPRSQWYNVASRAYFGGVLAFFVAKIASLVYQGERPFVSLGTSPKAAYLDNPGFPSDHALLVVFCAVVVWGATKRPRLAATVALMAGLVCVGRVLALVHTPVDVIGGATAAIIAGLVIYGRDFFTYRRTTT